MYRSELPQLSGKPFLTDGGIETVLVFQQGIELPCFAAFDVLKNQNHCAWLRQYFLDFVDLASYFNAGLILEAVTWRASKDWAQQLGYSDSELSHAIHKAVALLEEVRNASQDKNIDLVISGCLGPRGDGYNPVHCMSANQAEDYHSHQIGIFKGTAADMVTALTLNYIDEAVGVARAAETASIPVAISFTVETDGKLPTGDSLQSAIETVEEQTNGSPAYYMVNCAHPTHFFSVLKGQGEWLNRIRGVRANASRCSHEELDNATELDAGDPHDLGKQFQQLRSKLRNLNVLGGCCGTDIRHIGEIAKACFSNKV